MTLVNAINLKTGDVAEFDLINIKTSGNYKGLWDASTNTPFLTNGVGTEGDWYEVSVGGTVNFGAGDFVFSEGDTVSYIDGNWEKASEKIIDDSQISYNKTWSSAKIKEEIDIQVPLIVEEKVEEGLAGKQDLLTEDQLKAVNSGITAEKVAGYDGLSTDINNLSTEVATNKTDIATLKTDVGDIGDSITDLRNDKQDKLTETQLQAVESGITAEKIAEYDQNLEEFEQLSGEVATLEAEQQVIKTDLGDLGDQVVENNNAINTKNNIFQIDTLPSLVANVPNPFQYIGETEGSFIKGHFYEKTETDFTQWERTDNQTYVVTMADAVVDDGVYQADGKTMIGTITEISDDAMTYTDTDGQSVSTVYHSVFHSTGYEEIYDLEKYQIKLTAGNNITITEDGVISATGGGTGSNIASDITYDNATSGLTADNVQNAIDELSVEKLDKTTDVSNAGKGLIVGDDGAIGFSNAKGKVFGHVRELGLTTSATLAEITEAMPDGSILMLKVDVMTDPSEYLNIMTGTVTITRYGNGRIQAFMTEKLTGKTWTGIVDATSNAIVGWNELTSIDDTTTSADLTWSSSKISELTRPKKFTTSGGTKWIKLTLGNANASVPVTVTDQYGGKIEILGMTYDGTYKSPKVVRYSYGDWTTYSATEYSSTSQGDENYKIRRLFYYPTDGCYYLEVRQWTDVKVFGSPTSELIDSLPAETSEMTLIPESQYASYDGLRNATKYAQGGSPFSEMYSNENPYRKLTVDCYYARPQTFIITTSNGYYGKLFVAMNGASFSDTNIKVITENGTAPFEIKYDNVQALTGSGHYSVDVFIHKTSGSAVDLNIKPFIQGTSTYTKVYTADDFVVSTADEFTNATKTASISTQYATKNDIIGTKTLYYGPQSVDVVTGNKLTFIFSSTFSTCAGCYMLLSNYNIQPVLVQLGTDPQKQFTVTAVHKSDSVDTITVSIPETYSWYILQF